MSNTDIQTERMHIRYGRYHDAPLVSIYEIQEDQQFLLADLIGDDHGKSVITIGRAHTCDIQLNDPTVSLVHCELIVGDDGRYTIQDADSTNGLLVNDVHTTKTVLCPGMWLYLGSVELVSLGPDSGSMPITATTYTEFLYRASLLYGSDRNAAKHIGRSPSTIRRSRQRYLQMHKIPSP